MEPAEIQYTESFGQSDNVDTPMYRHYRLRSYHRSKDIGPYDVDRIVSDHKDKLVRTAQEFLVAESGQDSRLSWTNVLIEKSEGLFAHIRIKNSNYTQTNTYDVIVMGPDPKIVAEEITSIRNNYRIKTDEDCPGFFLMGSGQDRYGRTEYERVPLRENCLQSDEELALHYGEDFPEWSNQFANGLAEPGLSILRGAPGTGKTSYLRHVIAQLMATHRFYYLPTESVGLLSSNQLPEIWKSEHSQYPNATKVLVVEDAEEILIARGNSGSSSVASLLNLTDGFMGDLVRVHIICTMNCEVVALDEAVLRPGRQRFFREFEPLAFPAAKRLAKHLGKELSKDREYTLAELYQLDDVESGKLVSNPRSGPIGFGSNSE